MGLKQTAINVWGIIAAVTLPALALALSWQYGFVGIGLVVIVIGIVSFILYKEPSQSVDINARESASRLMPRSSVREVFKSREIWLVSGQVSAQCFL